MEAVLIGLLWFSALGCALMAGIYFAFSVFIMTALGHIVPSAGVVAMNAINRDILRSLFMPLFFATTLACLILCLWAVLQRPPSAWAIGSGGAIYVVGMFGVTMARNVPLNTLLAAAEEGSVAGDALWDRYRREWTRWNHVRTTASLIASALFIVVLSGI